MKIHRKVRVPSYVETPRSRRPTRIDRAAIYVDRQFDRLRFPRFGWRSILYIAFVFACIVFGTLHPLIWPRPGADPIEDGMTVGATCWVFGTVPFFLWNLASLAVAITKDRPASRQAIGVALPLAALALGWPLLTMLDQMIVRRL